MSSASLSSLAKVNLDPLLAFVMMPTLRVSVCTREGEEGGRTGPLNVALHLIL